MIETRRKIHEWFRHTTHSHPHGKKQAFLLIFLLATPAIALSVAVSRAHATSGLIGAWNMDEGTGTSLADSSGNGNNGTIIRGTGTGSPAWVSPGHDGSQPYALDFDGTGAVGTATDSVNLGTSPQLDQMNHYTVSLWVKFKAGYVGNGGAWANLVGRNSSGGNWAWMIYVNSAGHIRPHHRNSDGSYAPLTDSSAVMPIGQWVHIEQVADGSRLHLYINGQEDPNFPISYSGTTMSLPTASTYIGQDKRESAPLATISDVKIYNDAAIAPRLTTSAATNVAQSSATLHGTLTTLGDYTSAQVFFRYRLAGSNGAYTETSPQTVTTSGPFSANATGLSGNTQYEFIPVVEWQGRDGSQEAVGSKFTFTTPAYFVTVQVVNNLTTEDGGTGSFKLCLGTKPSAPVTIALSSSNANEGTVPASITIQPNDWNNCNANVVTVTGVDDAPPAADGSVPYTILTGDVTSTDLHYDALGASDVPDVSMQNQNNDPPGVVLSVVGNQTSESGGTARVQFRLLSAPSGNVTIPLSLSDTSEGSLGGVTNVTITPANWNSPQNNEVVITGLDDALTDGDVPYTLVTGDPTSSDTAYDALDASSVADASLINTDNDIAGVTITQTGNSTDVTEGGVTDTFSVVLNSQPAPGNSVVVSLQPDSQVDLGTGASTAKDLTFTNATWNTPQTVTVTANDDTDIEDNHTGLIVTSIGPSTTEPSYAGVDPADITAHITDNDDDNDGIPAQEEAAGPNGGDANNDGIPDSRQANVASFLDSVTGHYTVLELDPACSITAAGDTTEASLSAQDQTYQYPYGFIHFSANCGTPGFTTTIREYYYGVSDTDATLRKYNPTTREYFTINGAGLGQGSAGGQTYTEASFSITDGTKLDADGITDGIIVDPAGLGVITVSSGGLLTNTGMQVLLGVFLATAIITLGTATRLKKQPDTI